MQEKRIKKLNDGKLYIHERTLIKSRSKICERNASVQSFPNTRKTGQFRFTTLVYWKEESLPEVKNARFDF